MGMGRVREKRTKLATRRRETQHCLQRTLRSPGDRRVGEEIVERQCLRKATKARAWRGKDECNPCATPQDLAKHNHQKTDCLPSNWIELWGADERCSNSLGDHARRHSRLCERKSEGLHDAPAIDSTWSPLDMHVQTDRMKREHTAL